MCPVNTECCALSWTFLKQSVIRVNALCSECKSIVFLGKERKGLVCQTSEIFAIVDDLF